MRAIYDLNVLLDVLLDRKPHAAASTSALRLAEIGAVEGYLCAAGVDTLAYLLRKDTDTDGVMRHLTTLRRILRIADVTESVIDSALRLDWPDLEDAIVHESARLCGIEAIVTRNGSDFTRAAIPIYTPAKFAQAVAGN
ncbi:type II toxin-antitoxin system VapC family toxin [Candidatus Thiodictyon syntrophicum]|jgi:predicted nucleic acid-binding protein|uniref:PIN domain-containing protein n=1 Tax=Candidatus Thiodictyon syntrophicum TaxID=1166950 RepID=A0A2K8U5Q5_9GAMM|nr:PIN domain-containing protein [Candidatus Thiodictyon syntrophicum]AUB80912.1 hypothetical protein THSYN_08080 [Candidatus Thiodictyon syntrophicum]